MTDYYLFGAGWEGFAITRPEGLEVITYSTPPQVRKYTEFGDKTPDFEIVEFKVSTFLHSDGKEYFIACHDCEPDPNQIVDALNK